MNQKAIGQRIKKAREKKQLTQEQLSELVDLSPMHISVIERGAKPPKLETLINIANALGVSTDTLLQDVIDNRIKAVSSEAADLLGQLSPEEQRRVLSALRVYVDELK